MIEKGTDPARIKHLAIMRDIRAMIDNDCRSMPFIKVSLYLTLLDMTIQLRVYDLYMYGGNHGERNHDHQKK